MFCIGSGYREPLEFTYDKLGYAKNRLCTLRETVTLVEQSLSGSRKTAKLSDTDLLFIFQ